MLIGTKKALGLKPPEVIQVGIYPASLHDILEVKICLSVTYEVNFFADQFYIILCPAFVTYGAELWSSGSGSFNLLKKAAQK